MVKVACSALDAHVVYRSSPVGSKVATPRRFQTQASSPVARKLAAAWSSRKLAAALGLTGFEAKEGSAEAKERKVDLG